MLQQSVSTTWHANWIAAAGDGGDHYGVYYFRKQVKLPTKPASFKIYVSADNRYKLYVNGKLVSLGPARGDNFYWNYETVDIAPYLAAGKNTVAAMVFNEAQYRPEAQITVRTAFIVQGASPAEEVLNTNDTWRCIADKAFQPIPGFFFAAIKGQLVDMNQTISDWNMPGFDDAAWPMAANLFQGQPKGNSDGFGWMLVPSPLPQMELTYQRIPTLREEKGIDVPQSFPGKKTAVTIAPHTTATLLLDQNYETNAYITLNFSGGAHSGISMRYAESLFDNLAKNGRRKGNRNEIKGKDFVGVQDSILSNGKAGQTFTTLYWRSFRYLLLTIQTKDDPLVIDDLYGTFTGYPFKQRAVLNTNNAEMKTMLDIGWRTARLCAMETYFDCPFYEQLQYIGDTRIQAMVSYYNAGDDSLARHAISLIDQSRSSEGVTQSRWPTHDTQIIPGFSLWYIGMLHDYWMYRNDPIFVKRKLAGTRAILNFFSNYQQPDGSLKYVPYWTFVDWAGDNGWNFGGPPKGKDGSSAVFDLQLLWAYQWAAAMETSLGMPAYAKLYQEQALKLKQTIQRKYWSEAKQLYAETAEKNTFSQHTNALAILTGVANEGQYRQLGQKILADHSLTQCSIYFKYYMHMALVKAGMGDDYLSWLDVWRENIKLGLTTWAEEPDVQTSRSDCHAWGASPNIEFYRTLLGIDSYAPGFTQIKVQPHLGTLTHLSGSIPHPNGKVEAAYALKNGKWDIRIVLPPKTSGVFVWKNKNYTLKAGANTFKI
ncbi:hypothetical protein GCM10027037_05190 [Mucilaginibacter koreensis]